MAAVQVKNADLAKIGKGLYLVRGVTAPSGEGVFLYCRDNRKQTKKDYGWVIGVGPSGEHLRELCFAHDRRDKVVDQLNAMLRKRDQVVPGEPTKLHLPEPAKGDSASAAPAVRGRRAGKVKLPDDLDGMTVAQLVATHNDLATRVGAAPVSKWKGTKKDLIDTLQRMAAGGAKKAA